MKRVGLLIDTLWDIKGGAERQVYELLKRIDRNKFDVSLFVLHHREIPQEVKGVGRRVAGIGIKRIYGLRGIIEGIRFSKFLKRERIDILMTYHFASDIWGTVFGKLAGVPVIISNRRDAGFWRNKWHILAYKLINRWVNKVIVVSKAVKEVVIKGEGISENKVEVIYNGVDSAEFSNALLNDLRRLQVKESLGIKANDFVVGCVGNFRPVKGHKYLLEAVPEVVSKFPAVHFVFVGDYSQFRRMAGSRVGELNALNSVNAQNGQTRNVHFLGKRDDIPQLLSIMDVCVLPSLSEGLSNTLLEYMASGKPVIATNVGGNPEVVEDGKNGILVSAGDSKVLARQIIKLLEDRNFAESLGSQARSTVENRFNLNLQIKYMEDFLCSQVKREKRLRILHLISSGGLFGAEKVMLSLTYALNRMNIKTWVCAIRNTRSPNLDVIIRAKEKKIPFLIVDSRGKIDFFNIFSPGHVNLISISYDSGILK